jgi:hypothetical protein
MPEGFECNGPAQSDWNQSLVQRIHSLTPATYQSCADKKGISANYLGRQVWVSFHFQLVPIAGAACPCLTVHYKHLQNNVSSAKEFKQSFNPYLSGRLIQFVLDEQIFSSVFRSVKTKSSSNVKGPLSIAHASMRKSQSNLPAILQSTRTFHSEQQYQ